MEQVAVRLVAPKDHASWLHLRRRLWPDVDEDDHRRELAVLLDQDDDEGAVFLADDCDGLAGFIEVCRAPEATGCTSSPVALLEAWFVREDTRRAGIGARLVAAAEAWARQQGLVEMASNARADNAVSRRAHRALGFQETDEAVHFCKRIGPEDLGLLAAG